MRKCSKCILHNEECLDVIHRDNHGDRASEGIVNSDVLCRAMKAIVRLAKDKGCPPGNRKCLAEDTKSKSFDQSCILCNIKWALK